MFSFSYKRILIGGLVGFGLYVALAIAWGVYSFGQYDRSDFGDSAGSENVFLFFLIVYAPAVIAGYVAARDGDTISLVNGTLGGLAGALVAMLVLWMMLVGTTSNLLLLIAIGLMPLLGLLGAALRIVFVLPPAGTERPPLPLPLRVMRRIVHVCVALLFGLPFAIWFVNAILPMPGAGLIHLVIALALIGCTKWFRFPDAPWFLAGAVLGLAVFAIGMNRETPAPTLLQILVAGGGSAALGYVARYAPLVAVSVALPALFALFCVFYLRGNPDAATAIAAYQQQWPLVLAPFIGAALGAAAKWFRTRR